MIFWNALAAAALRAPCGGAMYKWRRGRRWGIVTDGRTPCPLSVPDSHLAIHLYGLQRTQPKQQSICESKRRARERGKHQKRLEKTVTRGKCMGGSNAAQNDRGRKDWTASVHHLSRKFYGHRRPALSPPPPYPPPLSPRRTHP